MKEMILCKYGEIVLKGLNRHYFEKVLERDVCSRFAGGRYGKFKIHQAQSTMYIQPQEEGCDIDGAFFEAKHVFGFTGVARAAVAEKDIEDLKRVTREYIPAFLEGKKTFKVEAKRSDKLFPLKSPEICNEIGAVILQACPWIRVDVHNPDITVRAEIRESFAAIHAGQEKGAGGIPYGSGGKAMLLLSGGIDSPVAGQMAAKRGLTLEAVHFESIPYTSELALDKVLRLASKLAEYTGKVTVNVVSLTDIQMKIKKSCNEEYFTLLLRRSMMRIAQRIARMRKAGALVTGESVGQVASQTLPALTVTNEVCKIPVLRPLICSDKDEIVTYARKIDTFDISIEPYEDCCTVFTPKHPKTKPELEKVLAEEAKADLAEEETAAVKKLRRFTVKKDNNITEEIK